MAKSRLQDFDAHVFLALLQAILWGSIAALVAWLFGASAQVIFLAAALIAVFAFLVLILAAGLVYGASRPETPRPNKIILDARPVYRLKINQDGSYQVGIAMSAYPEPESQAPDPTDLRCTCLEIKGDDLHCPVHGEL